MGFLPEGLATFRTRVQSKKKGVLGIHRPVGAVKLPLIDEGILRCCREADSQRHHDQDRAHSKKTPDGKRTMQDFASFVTALSLRGMRGTGGAEHSKDLQSVFDLISSTKRCRACDQNARDGRSQTRVNSPALANDRAK